MRDLLNPRALGFNYGNGWGSDPKPAIYHQGTELAKVLRAEAHTATAAAWQLDHCLWAVRIAETETEKERAIKSLEHEISLHQAPNKAGK